VNYNPCPKRKEWGSPTLQGYNSTVLLPPKHKTSISQKQEDPSNKKGRSIILAQSESGLY
jgi:hypothetical protein